MLQREMWKCGQEAEQDFLRHCLCDSHSSSQELIKWGCGELTVWYQHLSHIHHTRVILQENRSAYGDGECGLFVRENVLREAEAQRLHNPARFACGIENCLFFEASNRCALSREE